MATPIARRPSQGGVSKQVLAALNAAGNACKARHTELVGQGLYKFQVEVSVDETRHLTAAVASGRHAAFDNCLVTHIRSSKTQVAQPFAPMVVPLGYML